MESNDQVILPIKDIFFEAVSYPVRYFSLLIKFSIPIVFFWSLIVLAEDVEQLAPYLPGVSLILSAFYYATLVIAIVACHRIFLLSEESRSNLKVLHWSWREMRYIGYSIVISILVGLVAIPIVFVMEPMIEGSLATIFENIILREVFATFIMLPALYVFSRCSLILPAVALDMHKDSMNWVWQMSAGNGWRLTVLLSGLYLLVELFFAFLPTFDSLLYSIVLMFFWLVLGVVQVAVLSLSYAYLVDHYED